MRLRAGLSDVGPAASACWLLAKRRNEPLPGIQAPLRATDLAFLLRYYEPREEAGWSPFWPVWFLRDLWPSRDSWLVLTSPAPYPPTATLPLLGGFTDLLFERWP